MKKLTLVIAFSLIANIHAAIEILDRVAVIVDDGRNNGVTGCQSSLIRYGIHRYEQQNIPNYQSDRCSH
jgi:hypothetical protein